MKKQLLLLLVSFITLSMSAQRYLTPQFKDVSVTTTAYGFNYTVLAVPSKGHTIKQPLAVDIYQPVGDTETARPVAIIIHSGNFLPNPQNGNTNGLRIDSTAIELCTRLAKMGYVAASIDYRLGWNPLASTQEGRTSGLINGAYRGVQDANTAVRFFKDKAAAFKVDTNKIMMVGTGTGGYITLGAATLDKYSEIITTVAPANKFIGSNGLPLVIEKLPVSLGGLVINADPEGKLLGKVPPKSDGTPNPGPPPTGDTLNLPNWVNHTSKFHFSVNLGGALGDISWLDKNSPPMISIQTPTDIYAPYKSDILYVPVPPNPLPVVEVQGAFEVQKKVKELGLNKSFTDCKFKPEFDPYGAAVSSRNSGYEGLVPVYVKNNKDTAPWDFWDIKKFDTIPHPNAPTLSIHKVAMSSTPDASPTRARRYLDSLVGYFTPRAYVSMKLGNTAVCVIPTAKVTLTVDMSKAGTVDAAGVHVAGAFQGWDPAKTKLTQVGTSSIYTTTVDMPLGDNPYKFVNGNAWGKDEKIAAGATCNKAGSTDRLLNVTADVKVAEVCFGHCVTCDKVIATNDVAFDNALEVFPNPTTGELTMSFNLAQEANLNVRITNALGQTVISRDLQNATSGNAIFNLNNMSDGIYLVHISSGSKFSTKRIVVQK
jgi:dienelactone hydrolase